MTFLPFWSPCRHHLFSPWFLAPREEHPSFVAFPKSFLGQSQWLASEKDGNWSWADSIQSYHNLAQIYLSILSFFCHVQSQLHQNTIIHWFPSNPSGFLSLCLHHAVLFPWQPLLLPIYHFFKFYLFFISRAHTPGSHPRSPPSQDMNLLCRLPEHFFSLKAWILLCYVFGVSHVCFQFLSLDYGEFLEVLSYVLLFLVSNLLAPSTVHGTYKCSVND